MVRLNKSLQILALTMLIAFAGVASTHPELTPEKDFEYACAYMTVFYGTSCKGVNRPPVFYVPMSNSAGGRYYAGFIFINGLGVSWATQRELIFHETVHHIYHENFNPRTRCDSEEAARRATDAFMERTYSDQWREGYQC